MIDFLTPVSKAVLAHREILPSGVLGKQISVHSSLGVLPDLDDVNFAILGVKENRGDINFIGEELCFDEIRKSFYSLYPGNWSHKIIDCRTFSQKLWIRGNIKFYFSISFTYNFLNSLACSYWNC